MNLTYLWGIELPLLGVLGNRAFRVDEVGYSEANGGDVRVDPADMSGGMGVDNFPEWTKSQLLLLLIWNKLQEAYDSGDSELRVQINRAGDDRVGVRVGYPTYVNVSDEIPELSRGGEAVAVFESLRREGYLIGDFGISPETTESPVIYRLSNRGMVDIAKYPDPDRRFAAALAAAYRAINRSNNIPASEKRDMLDTVEKMASLANNVGGLSRAFFEGLSQGG
jgi:hypothetical protein